jgi:hypothetical protein
MSTRPKKTKAKNAATSGGDQDEDSTPFQKFCRWIRPSIKNPENFPHYLIATFTFGLGVFAFAAWMESRSGTAALQGQLSQMQKQSALTISQLRPKLALSFNGPKEPIKIEGEEGWLVTPTWINHGGSEGIYFWGWDNGRLFTPGAPKDFDFLTFGGDVSTASKVTIGINEPHLQISKFLSRNDVQSIVDKKSMFIMWGYVEYRESLPGNQVHHVHWCYEVFPVDAGATYIFSYSAYRPECNSSD